jgi:hypothetical protein
MVDIAWLQQKFSAVTDVKVASRLPDTGQIFLGHHADLVVKTWMGAVLHIYLIDKEPRLRDLRGILKENSRTGIGTLFIFNLALLPPASKALSLEDWQEALRVYSDGWLYGYKPDEDDLIQVHLYPAQVVDQFGSIHHSHFVIEHVSVRQREVGGALKGDWYQGDIASVAYKRRINYERINQRFHYETRTPPRAVGQAPVDTLTKYYQLLGIERSASEKEVKSAFRRLALNIHPDVSALPRQEAERRIKELIEAYEFIKEFHGWS